MEYITSIVVGVSIAVIGGVLLEEVKGVIAKAKKAKTWAKDSVRFTVALAICIAYSVLAAVKWTTGEQGVVLYLLVAAAAALGLISMFYSYCRAFFVFFDAANNLLNCGDDQ